MKWITPEPPKIDRITCPSLIVNFIDPEAELLYVPAGQVEKAAVEIGTIPYDIKDAELDHHGDECSFDAFIRKYDLHGC